MGEHGGISLTPSKAFKRVFVHWAAAGFDWPGHTAADLFEVNKVLNEPDFMPLMVLHELMIALKLSRHYKSEFRLTKAGKALVGHPGRIFDTVVPALLFRVDHTGFSRLDDDRYTGAAGCSGLGCGRCVDGPDLIWQSVRSSGQV